MGPPRGAGTSRSYRDPAVLTLIVTIAIAVDAVLSLVGAVSTLSEIGLLERMREGGDWSMEEAEANDLRQALIGFTQLGVFVATAVLFLVWVHRVVSNASTFRRLPMTPGWAVGSYFVPIVNFWKPLTAMREAWWAGAPERSGPGARISRGTPAVLGCWWASWLVSCVLGQVVFRLALRAEQLDELLLSSRLSLASDLWDVPLALAALAVVHGIVKRHREAEAAVPVAPATPAGPEGPLPA